MGVMYMTIGFLRINTLHFLLLFILFNLILTQRCKHNEFRCNTGECLKTEVLCNGRRDCPNGEDERRGGAGWNCRWVTLSQGNCDPATQFKCRFGGCISRNSICNGKVDCYGGGDEAVDVCEKGTSNLAVPAVQSVQPSRPSQSSRPIPTAPPRSRPTQPRTRAPVPQTTSRAEFPPPQFGNGDCPPVNEDPSLGFEIQCSKSGYPVDCSKISSPSGTVALYSCNHQLFTPISNTISSASRKCENGQWTQFDTIFGCEPKCGEGLNDISQFVVGGSTAKTGKWPWMVAIYERSSKNKMEFICGATLISNRAVVTAAHCVVRRDSGNLKSLTDLRIVLGKFYRPYDKKSSGEQERAIGEVIVNPDYNRVSLYNDIAIIKLSQTVRISTTVRPACLPQPTDYTQIGQLGTLIGWGRADNNVFKEELQQAQLPVVSSNDCVDAHPQFAYLVHKGTFCAGYLNGTSACDGDSGGPLIFPDRYNRHKWVLHGVVSAGIAASGVGRGCNPHFYTVFTHVGFPDIRLWIDRVLASQFTS